MPHHVLGEGAFEWIGSWYKTLLSSEATEGTIAIVDNISPPGFGPPRHIHHNQDEIFVILSGQTEFWFEGTRFIRGPGETAFIPKGREHTFRIAGDEWSRHLVTTTPGGLDAFFEEMGRRKLAIPQDMEQVVETARRHALEFTGPPLEDE